MLSILQIGILSVFFNVSGIIFGLVTSFFNMKNFIDKEYPKIDIIIGVLLSIGYAALVALCIMVTCGVQNFYVVMSC